MARTATLIPIALAVKDGRIKEDALDPAMRKALKRLDPLVMGGSSAPPGSSMTPSLRRRTQVRGGATRCANAS